MRAGSRGHPAGTRPEPSLRRRLRAVGSAGTPCRLCVPSPRPSPSAPSPLKSPANGAPDRDSPTFASGGTHLVTPSGNAAQPRGWIKGRDAVFARGAGEPSVLGSASGRPAGPLLLLRVHRNRPFFRGEVGRALPWLGYKSTAFKLLVSFRVFWSRSRIRGSTDARSSSAGAHRERARPAPGERPGRSRRWGRSPRTAIPRGVSLAQASHTGDSVGHTVSCVAFTVPRGVAETRSLCGAAGVRVRCRIIFHPANRRARAATASVSPRLGP